MKRPILLEQNQGFNLSLTGTILSLYAGGAILYYISRGWFRTALVVLTAILGSFYLLVLAAGANPSSGIDPYAGLGLGIFVILASLPGLPASGVLFAFLGDTLAKYSKGKYAPFILKILCLALFPIFLFYVFQIAPANRYANIHNHHFKGHYAIQFNGTYLDLPCRREFHRFRPERDCSLQKPLVRTDFQKVDTLKVWPKGHTDQNNRCGPEAPDREEIVRFCDVKLLPYNVNFLFETSQIAKRLRRQNRRGNTPSNESTPEKTLGNLKIIEETTKPPSGERPSSINYHFKLDRDATTVFLHCYNTHSKDRAIFECTMKINYNDKIWASALRFKAPLEQIESEAIQITGEVSEFYSYLIETYGVPA